MKKLIYLVPTVLIIISIFIINSKRKSNFEEKVSIEKYKEIEEEVKEIRKRNEELLKTERDLSESLIKAKDSIYILNKKIERMAYVGGEKISSQKVKKHQVTKNEEAKKIEEFFIERYENIENY